MGACFQRSLNPSVRLGFGLKYISEPNVHELPQKKLAPRRPPAGISNKAKYKTDFQPVGLGAGVRHFPYDNPTLNLKNVEII